MAHRKFVVDKTKKIIELIIICSIFVYPLTALGYSTLTTHRAITNESAKFFNHYYPDQPLADGQISLLVKGSADEDTPPRWLNHFYDPVYNRGFRGLLSSKNWAENTSAQALLINKTPLAEYFSASADYSWERAIYDYVYGDKNRAFEALGHTLHLIQDATVPDHTRDDAHPIWSTYESYAKRYELGNTNLVTKLVVQNSQPILFADLGQYFDYLASFSNNNFFSDDTIFYPDYSKPKIISERIEKSSDNKNYRFGLNNFGKLVLIGESFNHQTGDINKTYLINDLDKKIPSDYWANLSDKAVLGSAGVIKLFFTEVEREKQTKRLFEKNKNLVQKFWDNLNDKIGSLLASVNFAGANNEPDNSSTSPSVLLDDGANQDQEPVEEPDPIAELVKKIEELKREIEQLKQNQVNQDAGSLIASTTRIISSGGSSSSFKDLVITDEQSDPIISPPIITLPADFSQAFATNTIIFSGTASSGLVIFNDFNHELATASTTGDWQVILTGLPQGTSTIKFYARDNDNNVSEPTTINLTVDSLPLAINLSISNCDQSLAVEVCYLISTSTLNLAWSPTKSGHYNYDLVKTSYAMGEWGDETTSSAETSISVSTGLEANDFNKEIKWQVLAKDAGSGQVIASSSVTSTIFHPRPIVINELGWAGTTASSSDEWLELRNFASNYNLDLNNHYLTDADKTWQVDLSGSIPAQGYYLIERGDDGVISNRSANLVANWGADPLAKGFNSSRIGLKLWRTIDGQEELIDQTPEWDKSSATPTSLERTWEDKISTDLSSWEDNSGCEEGDGPCALDRAGNQTFGTPGVINFASIPRLW